MPSESIHPPEERRSPDAIEQSMLEAFDSSRYVQHTAACLVLVLTNLSDTHLGSVQPRKECDFERVGYKTEPDAQRL